MGVYLENLGKSISAVLEGLPKNHPDRRVLTRILITMTGHVEEEERWNASTAAKTLSEEGKVDTDALAWRINIECGAELEDKVRLRALYYWDQPNYHQDQVPEEWKNVMDTLTSGASGERAAIKRAIGALLRANLKVATSRQDVPPIETVGDWRRAQTYNSKVVNRIRPGTREFLMITFRNVKVEGEIPRSA